MKSQPEILSLNALVGDLKAYDPELAARHLAAILREGRAAVLQHPRSQGRVDWSILLLRALGSRGA